MALITAIIVLLWGVIAGAFSQQLTDEFKAWIPWIVRRVIRKAVARLPQNQRERFEEEWQSHIDEVPGEIGKIYVALGCLFAARKMASILSADRERTVLAEVVTRAFDLALAVGFLFLVSPLLVLMALSVWLEGTGPVLVAEDIVGMHGRIFGGYTFATSGRVGKMLDSRPTRDPQRTARRHGYHRPNAPCFVGCRATL
jgi:Bacterial sugar transferase